MYNGQIVNELLKQRKIKVSDLNAYLHVNSSSITQITDGNPTASKLEKIADFFGVSIDIFFIRHIYVTPGAYNVNGNSNVVGNVNNSREQELTLQFKAAETLIKEKDKLIDEKEKRIKVLEDMVKMLKK